MTYDVIESLFFMSYPDCMSFLCLYHIFYRIIILIDDCPLMNISHFHFYNVTCLFSFVVFLYYVYAYSNAFVSVFVDPGRFMYILQLCMLAHYGGVCV